MFVHERLFPDADTARQSLECQLLPIHCQDLAGHVL